MDTLTYGRKRPANGDKGAPVFTALADNITLDDAHDHDGVDSQKINTSNLTRGSVSVTDSGWVAVGDGTFKKTVTMPGAHTWGACVISVFCSGGTDADLPVYPKMVKLTATTFELHSLVNNQAFTVLVT